MGCFSWLKADNLTKIANVYTDMPYKCLIPKEYGGGYIHDHYQQYGRIGKKEDGSPRYDLFELLAFWNRDFITTKDGSIWIRGTAGMTTIKRGTLVRDLLIYSEEQIPGMKEIDQDTERNRSIGILLQDMVEDIPFPLKLVSASYKENYEDCEGRSKRDPDQGFYPVER
ncbi:MAG: hypothetical protein Q4B26_00920 [Eubacteriales bacterium]|nr:hypothetical protein [Eubacteriales bacterium]